MAFKSRKSIDMDRFASFLQDAVEKVKTREDPVELHEIKKIFKRNVPLVLRSYVAAYMLKSMLGGGTRQSKNYKKTRNYEGRNKKGGENNNRFSLTHQEGDHDISQKAKRNTIDESLAETIFISTGRNRRVFHRDLLALIIQVVGLDRDRIGEIRILDNYSFVQVFSEDAQRIIDALNGYEFRGRKLTVSFSRKKDEGTDDGETSMHNDFYKDLNDNSFREEL